MFHETSCTKSQFKVRFTDTHHFMPEEDEEKQSWMSKKGKAKKGRFPSWSLILSRRGPLFLQERKESVLVTDSRNGQSNTQTYTRSWTKFPHTVNCVAYRSYFTLVPEVLGLLEAADHEAAFVFSNIRGVEDQPHPDGQVVGGEAGR